MYDKLVRDNIPEIIEENNEFPVTHKADKEEFEERLNQKLLEEAEEYIESGKKEELADLLEVIEKIKDLHDISDEEVEEKRISKKKERGGFENRIVLDDVK